jgi:hypothetical protein
MGFNFWIRPIEKRSKNYKDLKQPKKKTKFLFKSLGFQHPKMALFFISEPGQLGT